ncbi:MAG: hypothetical protein AAF330_05195 [Pseudomonadota bacterium]
MNLQRYALQIAEKLREIATRQGNVPYDKGDLAKAHVSEPVGTTDARLAVNTPYARAVHDGRGPVTIKPKRKKALTWRGRNHPVKSVKQPARKGNPWLARAVATLESEGVGFLSDELGQDVADELTKGLRARGLTVRRE